MEFTEKASYSLSDVETAKEAFKISELICDISSSDPYAREYAKIKLGGSMNTIFRNLAERIMSFTDRIENSYQ